MGIAKHSGTMKRAASWLTVAALWGCSAPQQQQQQVDPPPACEASATATVISEGGRRTVELTLSEGVTGWSVVDSGPFAATQTDLTHLKLEAPYELSGDYSVRLALDCGGAAELPVKIRRLGWTQLPTWTEGTDGPLAREYGAFWLDAADPSRALLYGGFVYRPRQFTPATDAWALDLASARWSKVITSGTPPSGTGGRIATRPGSPDALYLGGVTATRDTPVVLAKLSPSSGGVAWSDVSAAGGQGDYQPGFFFDARRDRYLSLCGANNTLGWHCEVRTLDATATEWRPVTVAGTPPQGRNGHFYVYDAENDRVVLFGGDANGNTLGDTWALELGEATPRWVSLGNEPSMRRRNGAWVLDAVNHRLVMWGGTADGATAVDGVWVLSLERGKERWLKPSTLNPPKNRASALAIYDSERERMIAGLGNSEQGIFADLWALQL
jgi:hypothetical protein